MSWPTMSDYQDTIQNPNTCFSDPELKNGTPVLNNLGLPKPIAGGFACVYQMICGTRNYAVRCFLSEQLELEKRYKIISDYLRKTNLSYMVNFEFISAGIKVKGQWFPILKMEWINGESLNVYLEKNLNNPQKLKALAFNFMRLINDLRKHSIAHGDLQHENILVSNEELKLIDYDGLYVPGLETIPSGEYGHRNYQHPARSEKDFGPNLDNFSAWIIYTSILALCINPNLWDQFNAGDGSLIFRKEDFLNPDQSPALIFFEQSSTASLRFFAFQLKSLLNYDDVSKIPTLDPKVYSRYINIPGIPPPGLPSWLQDCDHIQTTDSNNRIITQHKGSGIWDTIWCNVAKKLENLKMINLSSLIRLVYKKRYRNQNHYLKISLQKYNLEDSIIPGIGPQLIKSLNKAGITTAADILNIHIEKNNRNRTKAVALIEVSGRGKIHIQGIGPIKARALMEWKNHLETNLIKQITFKKFKNINDI